MIRSTHVYAPARLALVGDHLDWLAGEAITCTVDGLYSRFVMTVEAEDEKASHGKSRLLTATAQTLDREGHHVPPLRIRECEQIPRGAGLGSSAAYGVSLIAGASGLVNLHLSRKEWARLATSSARLAGIDGGLMDEYAVALGGANHLRFQNSLLESSHSLYLPRDAAFIVVVPKQRRFSGDVVSLLRKRAQIADQRLRRFVKKGLTIVAEMRSVLVGGDGDLVRLGLLLTEAHNNLRDNLDVSTPALDEIVRTSISRGAYGAKMVGAGGGGSVVVLAGRESSTSLSQALRNRWFETYICTAGYRGVTSSPVEHIHS